MSKLLSIPTNTNTNRRLMPSGPTRDYKYTSRKALLIRKPRKTKIDEDYMSCRDNACGVSVYLANSGAGKLCIFCSKIESSIFFALRLISATTPVCVHSFRAIISISFSPFLSHQFSHYSILSRLHP